MPTPVRSERHDGSGGIGERLQAARAAASMSPRDLEKLAGLSRGYVLLIEGGTKSNIEARTARSLARVLGLSLDWLLDGRGSAPSAASIKASAKKAGHASAH